MKIRNGAHPAFVGSQIANTPSSHAEGLRQTGNRNRMSGHSRQRGRREMLGSIEEKILINLVREQEEIVLKHKFSDLLKFALSEDLSARVRWGIKNKRPGAGRNGGAQSFKVNLPVVRQQWHGDRFYAEAQQGVDVVPIERFKQHHLIARVQQGQAGSIQCPGRT